MADAGRRGFQPGDEEIWLRVLQAAFQSWPKVDMQVPAIDHLRWKARSNLDPPIEHPMLEAGGAVVAGTILWKRRIKLRDRTVVASTGMDMSIHPDYQRQQILTRSHDEEWRPDADITFGYPSGHVAVAKLRARRPATGIAIANVVDVLVHEFDSASAPGKTAAGSIRIVPTSTFDERIDAFWQEASMPYDFAIVRDREYLNWRFCDPRAGSFTVRQAEEERAIGGYAVTSMQADGRGFIADLLALPDRDDIVLALLNDALQQLQLAGAATVECWVPRYHPYRHAIDSSGFRHKRRTIEMHVSGIRIEDAELAFLEDPRAAVHVSLGDTDLV